LNLRNTNNLVLSFEENLSVRRLVIFPRDRHLSESLALDPERRGFLITGIIWPAAYRRCPVPTFPALVEEQVWLREKEQIGPPQTAFSAFRLQGIVMEK
jgi:hypothetical protein